MEGLSCASWLQTGQSFINPATSGPGAIIAHPVEGPDGNRVQVLLQGYPLMMEQVGEKN